MTFPMAACWWRSPKWRWPDGIGAEHRPGRHRADAIPFWFGEDQARYVIAAPEKVIDKIEDELRAPGIIHAIIGKTTASKVLRVAREGEASLADLRKAHEGWFPTYMEAPHGN